MMRFIGPRLRKPLLRGIALLGVAGAWVIGSRTWEPAVVIAVVAVGQVVAWYIGAGEDTDESALLGSRADERQRQVRLRARALSGTVAMAAAYVGLVIALAVRRADAWPFVALLAVTGFAYLLGLSTYGAGEPGPEGEVIAGYRAGSPVRGVALRIGPLPAAPCPLPRDRGRAARRAPRRRERPHGPCVQARMAASPLGGKGRMRQWHIDPVTLASQALGGKRRE